MTQPNLSDTIAFLARTPGALGALLRDLPDDWTHRNEGERTWTVVDVVGHLIYGEQTDWMPRAKLILEHGESRAFEPFDMMGHIQVCEGRSLAVLLDEFARLRAANLADLHALGHENGETAGCEGAGVRTRRTRNAPEAPGRISPAVRRRLPCRPGLDIRQPGRGTAAAELDIGGGFPPISQAWSSERGEPALPAAQPRLAPRR